VGVISVARAVSCRDVLIIQDAATYPGLVLQMMLRIWRRRRGPLVMIFNDVADQPAEVIE
jgi:hypothetical protein